MNQPPPKRIHWLWKFAAGLIALLVLGFLLGPVNEFGPDAPAARAPAPVALNELDNWLTDSEAAFQDLRPGTAKTIIWAGNEKKRTPWSVVYIHGFSATRMETAPLADEIAKALGANLFYTRLSGHGLPGVAMGRATTQEWLADTLEAVRIGESLGEKVLVISCSTGSTLSTWLGTSPEADKVSAHVFISPNFGLKNKLSELVNGHWGHQIAFAVTGDTISYSTTDPLESVAWTTSYPTQAIFPMLALVKKVRDSDLSSFSTPVLVLYSAADQTVDPAQIKQVFARLGSKQKTIEPVIYSQSLGQHVLAGSIRDPQAVQPMAKFVTDWIHQLPSP